MACRGQLPLSHFGLLGLYSEYRKTVTMLPGNAIRGYADYPVIQDTTYNVAVWVQGRAQAVR
jgi:hypothetical protein